MRLGNQLFQHTIGVPSNWEDLQTYSLMEKCGLVEFPYAGIPSFNPLGKILMDGVEGIIKTESGRAGFSEVYLPLVQRKDLLEATNRAEIFADEFMSLSGANEGMILTPTNEEVYLDMARRGLTSYRQLPIRIFQIADKFRGVMKPKGVLRTKQFRMCDMMSLDANEDSLRESAALFEDVVDNVFATMGMAPFRVEKDRGKYVDYLIPCLEGETIITPRGTNAEYAEERSGDTVQSSSVAMYFIFEQFENVQPTFQASDGSRQSVLLGTYGFGIQRCVHAAIEVHRDELGIALPASLRPFDTSIILLDPESPEQASMGDEIYNGLMENGIKPCLDNRNGRSLKQKAEYADFLGNPAKLIIGRREAEEGIVTFKKRGERQGHNVSSDLTSICTALAN